MTQMVNYTLNGKTAQISASASAEALLESLGLAGRRVAMMINDEIISKDRRSGVFIQQGDRVEIIHMVGGG